MTNFTRRRAVYEHRFLRFTEDLAIMSISRRFAFRELVESVEFCAGLALSPDGQTLLASFGVMDEEAWVVKLPLDGVLDMIR